jgi:hypothetical protein
MCKAFNWKLQGGAAALFQIDLSTQHDRKVTKKRVLCNAKRELLKYECLNENTNFPLFLNVEIWGGECKTFLVVHLFRQSQGATGNAAAVKKLKAVSPVR